MKLLDVLNRLPSVGEMAKVAIGITAGEAARIERIPTTPPGPARAGATANQNRRWPVRRAAATVDGCGTRETDDSDVSVPLDSERAGRGSGESVEDSRPPSTTCVTVSRKRYPPPAPL